MCEIEKRHQGRSVNFSIFIIIKKKISETFLFLMHYNNLKVNRLSLVPFLNFP